MQNNEFQVPAKPWTDEKIKLMKANADLLPNDVRKELGMKVVETEDDSSQGQVNSPSNEPQEEDSKVVSVKVLGMIPVMNEQGEQTGELEIGSVQEVPETLAKSWIELQLAEAVDNQGDQTA